MSKNRLVIVEKFGGMYIIWGDPKKTYYWDYGGVHLLKVSKEFWDQVKRDRISYRVLVGELRRAIRRIPKGEFPGVRGLLSRGKGSRIF